MSGSIALKSHSGLEDALGQHGIGDLEEASDVGTTLQVGVVLLGCLDGCCVDILHDRLESRHVWASASLPVLSSICRESACNHSGTTKHLKAE